MSWNGMKLAEFPPEKPKRGRPKKVKEPTRNRIRTVTFSPRSSDSSLDIQIEKSAAEELYREGKIVYYVQDGSRMEYGPKIDPWTHPRPSSAPSFVAKHRVRDHEAYNPKSSNPKHW